MDSDNRYEKTLYGNSVACGRVIHRDWGWAPEYVDAMWRMLQTEKPEDFVVATGKSHSLEEFCSVAFSKCNLDWREHVDIDQSLFRPSEIIMGKGNPTKAHERLDWQAQLKMPQAVCKLVEAEMKILS